MQIRRDRQNKREVEVQGQTMEAGRERMNRYPSVAPSSVDIHVVASRVENSIDSTRRPLPRTPCGFYFTVLCNAYFVMRIL